MHNIPKTIKNVKYLAKGKRSLVYTGQYKKKKVTIKVKNPDSKAIQRMQNEAKFLKILNKYGVGPKLISSGKNYLIYEFVEGVLFVDYLEKNKKVFPIIKKILDQCRILDKLKINKLEFTRPKKHIFIKDKKIVMIDFERCYKTNNPKNVTQFCQFLIKNKLMKKNIKVLKNYKAKQTEKNFKEILKLIKKEKNYGE
ncbi:hypothetical protein K8R33_03460 [archaeon]|nr:hypothetical protein [archaeon]